MTTWSENYKKPPIVRTHARRHTPPPTHRRRRGDLLRGDLLRGLVDQVEVGKLYETFMELSDGGKVPLDEAAFQRGLGMLEKAGLRNLDKSPFAHRLFQLLDTNKDGRVDLREFVTGLSMLCKGTAEEKLERQSNAHTHAHPPTLTSTDSHA